MAAMERQVSGVETGPEAATRMAREAEPALRAMAAEARPRKPAHGVPPAQDGAAIRASYSSGRMPTQQMTPEEERVLIEHLPIVRFLARRIHERLPQHVDIDDLFSAGVVGLMDAFAKFDATKKVQFPQLRASSCTSRRDSSTSLRTLDWSLA